MDGRNKIGGKEQTIIKTDNLVNNGTKIGDGGVTYVEAKSIKNQTTTNQLSEISGDNTYVTAIDGNIENLGGKRRGTGLVSVVAENGQIINTSTKNTTTRYNGEYDRTTHEEIASVGEISSQGTTYIKGQGYTSVGAQTLGEYVAIDVSGDVNIKSLELNGEDKFGSNSNNYSLYKETQNVGSEVIGKGSVTIKSGNDVNVTGSLVGSNGNTVIKAENDINIKNDVNSIYEESRSSSKSLFKKEQDYKMSYAEINSESLISGNNVLLSSGNDVNVVGSNVVADDQTGTGGAVKIVAGNDINISSATTDSMSASYHSESTGIGSLAISAEGAQSNQYQQRQNRSNIIANGGNIIFSSGDDTTIAGSTIKTTDNISVRAVGDVVITGNNETYNSAESSYEGGLFRGGDLYEYEANKVQESYITNNESVLKAGGNIDVSGDNVLIAGSDLDSLKNINIIANKDIIVISKAETSVISTRSDKIEVGLFGDIDGLSLEFGAEAKYNSKATQNSQVSPDESTIVANGNVNMTSGSSIYLEGDVAAGNNINLKSKDIIISDSKGFFDYLEKELSARLSLSVELDFNNVIDTLKSLKDFYKGIQAVGNIGELDDIVRNILDGDTLLETLAGHEDTINALNNLFKGPSEGSGTAGIFVKASVDYSKNKGNGTFVETTTLTAGNDINIDAENNLEINGSSIVAFDDINIEAETLDIHASKSEKSDKNQSMGLSGTFDVLNPSIALSGYYNGGKTEGYSYNNSVIKASDDLNINTKNGTIEGANLEADDIKIVAEEKLTVSSLQDKETIRQTNINVNVGNLSPTNKPMTGQQSYGAGLSYTKGDKEWVEIQTSIIGRDSVNISVGGKLELNGAVIANEENGIDEGNLNITASEIKVTDITSYDNLITFDANVSVKELAPPNKKAGSENPTIRVKVKANGEQEVVKEKKPENFENDGAVGVEGHEYEKVSYGTIGNGNITATNGDVSAINRDITKSEETTKEIDVEHVSIDYNDERKDWGQIDLIIAQNAGTLGAFIDDTNEKFRDKESNFEKEFIDASYKAMTGVEDFIDIKLKNQILGLIPTSGQHGGIGEQIVKEIITDKNDEIVIKSKLVNGVFVRSAYIVSGLGEIPLTDETIKLFGNGMTEELENAIKNAATQYAPENIKEGEEYSVVLIYNKTRGLVSDAVESFTGKVFNGDWDSLGATIGVSRGFRNSLETMNPEQKYELKLYSQNNIISDGALNLMLNNGEQFGETLILTHTGNPKANKVFEAYEDELNINNLGSTSNSTDPITSESASFFGTHGLISEMKSSSESNEVPAWLNVVSYVPIIGDAMGQTEIYPMFKLKEVNEYTNEEKTQIMLHQGFTTDKQFEKFVTNAHGTYYYNDINYAQQLVAIDKERYEAKKKGDDVLVKQLDKKKEDINDERNAYVTKMMMTSPLSAPNGMGSAVDARDQVRQQQLNESISTSTINGIDTNIPTTDVIVPTSPVENEGTTNVQQTIDQLRERVGE